MPLWQTLTASPHRPLFFIGALQAVLSVGWWLLLLLARLDFAAPVHPSLAPGAAHAWLMLYGLFPFFVFGFLFTALPNWVEGGRISRPAYLAAFLPMGLGAALFYPGLYYPPLALLAQAPYLAGWLAGVVSLLRVLRAGPSRDKRQPWLAWAALVAGLAGAALFALWLILEQEIWLRASLALAVWGFLTPLFLAVCHRMVPWFTSRVVANYVSIRPYGPLWAMTTACAVHGVLEALDMRAWTWLADVPLAVIAFWFVSRWGILRALPERLLGMLHIGFVWGATSFALYGLDSLMQLAGGGGLGLAPLHALGIGFFSAMLLAMASRVSLGHSGRPLKADGLIWTLFWLLQGAALIRMAPDLLPGLAPDWLMPAAALVWLLAFIPWAARHLPWFVRPRADGKPG